MKNLITKSIFILSLLAVFSCSEDEFTIAEEISAPTSLLLSTNMVDLNEALGSNPALTVTWNDADYGFQGVVKYTLELSSDEAFTNPVEAGTTQGTRSITWTVAQLNTVALDMGIPPNEEATVYIRVKSFLGTQGEIPQYSSIESFTLTPFSSYTFKDYYLVGNATSADWDNNNNNPPLFRDASDENLYTYTGFFTKPSSADGDGRFKLLEARGQWQPQWGVTAFEPNDNIITAGGIAGNPGTQSDDPGRFGVSSEGYYTFTVDFNDQTFTIEAFDSSSATTYTSLALIGDAVGGWGDADEVELTALASDPHIWYNEDVTLGNGGMKFRANDGWDANWGGTNSYNQTGVFNGPDNIPGISGIYRVWFNDLTGDYMIIPKE